MTSTHRRARVEEREEEAIVSQMVVEDKEQGMGAGLVE